MKNVISLAIPALAIAACSISPDVLQEPRKPSRSPISSEDTYQVDGTFYCRLHRIPLTSKNGFVTPPYHTISVGDLVFEAAKRYPNAIHIAESLERTDIHTWRRIVVYCERCEGERASFFAKYTTERQDL